MKKLGFIAVLFLAVVGLFACAGQKGTSTNKSSKLNVVATNSIIADITMVSIWKQAEMLGLQN